MKLYVTYTGQQPVVADPHSPWSAPSNPSLTVGRIVVEVKSFVWRPTVECIGKVEKMIAEKNPHLSNIFLTFWKELED